MTKTMTRAELSEALLKHLDDLPDWHYSETDEGWQSVVFYVEEDEPETDDDDLVLSGYEKGYLTAYYDTTVFEHMCNVCDEDWFGVQIGERMFDLNAWADEETGDFICVVYECFLNERGEWSTDAAGRKWYLTGADNAPS